MKDDMYVSEPQGSIDGLIATNELSFDEFAKLMDDEHRPKRVLAHFPETDIVFRGKSRRIVNEAKWCSNWFWKGFHGVTQFSRDWKIRKVFKNVYGRKEGNVEEIAVFVEEYQKD